MASPRLILRFRELTPGIDTMKEHCRLLAEMGYVWWGWWKKDSEIMPREDLQRLRKHALGAGETTVRLIDTSAERLHSASLTDISLEMLSLKESQRVPKYYRGRGSVAAWFKLSAIKQDIGYDAAIESLIGQSTLKIDWEHKP